MSYIVPMKKPICINCPFRSLDSCALIYLMSDKDGEVTVYVNTMTVSPDCPLIELPPHGRLIDADKIDFRNDAMHDGTGQLVVADNFMNGVLWINDCIDRTPTVIEPEGSET